MSLFSRRVDKQLEAYQRELVDTHYKEVENMYRQIRGWRHDYRNHIQVLKAFAAKGDMDAIRAYLDELDTDLNTVDTVVKTGNAMAAFSALLIWFARGCSTASPVTASISSVVAASSGMINFSRTATSSLRRLSEVNGMLMQICRQRRLTFLSAGVGVQRSVRDKSLSIAG